LYPQNFINQKILIGDNSDNIPGVKGLGPKKLFKLFPELEAKQKITLDDIFDINETNSETKRLYNRK